MKNDINSLRSGKEFVSYATKHGGQVDRQCGSHATIKTEKGMCVIPVHPGDLGKGLRLKIVKTLMAILALAVIGVMTFGFIF